MRHERLGNAVVIALLGFGDRSPSVYTGQQRGARLLSIAGGLVETCDGGVDVGRSCKPLLDQRSKLGIAITAPPIAIGPRRDGRGGRRQASIGSKALGGT